MTRPVSYLNVSVTKDGMPVQARITLSIGQEICARYANPDEICFHTVSAGALQGGRIGRTNQRPLHESGDQVSIDWGYFYAVAPNAEASETPDGMKISVQAEKSLFLLGYDDLSAIEYFGKPLSRILA